MKTSMTKKKEKRLQHILTSRETLTKNWDFWHKHRTISTLTTRPAKLRISDRPKIQENFSFIDTVKVVTNERNIKLYESLWMLLEKTIRELYSIYYIYII